MEYEIEAKLKSAKVATRVTPENAAEILRQYPISARSAASKIAAIEAMSPSELAKSASEILDLWSTIRPAIGFEEPEGKGHEPHIQEYRNWALEGRRSFMEQFFDLTKAAPDNVVERLSRVVDSLPGIIEAQRRTHSWHEEKRVEPTLERVRELLGGDASASNPSSVAQLLLNRLGDWERVTPLALAKERPTIHGVHGALDVAFMFSPVAMAVLDGAQLPRPPDGWEEELIVAMGTDAVQRFHRVSNLAVRAAVAESLISTTNERASGARWSRLDSVRERAFEIRRSGTWKSRAAAIRSMVPEIRAMARDAGEPLTGDDPSVIETITRWFREAGVS